MNRSQGKSGGLVLRLSRAVERGGNRLPHPFYIYLILIAIVYIVSFICSVTGVSVTYDALDQTTGELVPTTLTAVNLLSRSSLQNILANFVTAYGSNIVLPTILVMTMFVAIADRSGFFSDLLRKSLMKTPRFLSTYLLAVIGVCCSIMSDAGLVLGPTLGAVLFKSLGRNPWLGIMIGYGGAAAGFTACLVPTVEDVLNSTITNSISEPLGTSVHAFSVWYFMIVATLFIGAAITFIAEKYLVNLLGDRKLDAAGKAGLGEYALTTSENKGLKYAGFTFLGIVAIMLILCIPQNGFFRNEDGGFLPSSPLVDSLIPILCIIFAALGIAYGKGSGALTSAKDIPQWMSASISDLGSLIVNFFAIATFIYVFGESNLSGILAVAGERFLRSIGLTGLPLLCIFAISMGIMSLFMYGGSSRWAIFAPIFVPMFMRLGIHPAFIGLAYRIGDSYSANITPLNSCLMLTLAMMVKYRDPEINSDEPGLGTILSSQIPISIGTLIVMLSLLIIFYCFNIPLGPANM